LLPILKIKHTFIFLQYDILLKGYITLLIRRKAGVAKIDFNALQPFLEQLLSLTGNIGRNITTKKK